MGSSSVDMQEVSGFGLASPRGATNTARGVSGAISKLLFTPPTHPRHCEPARVSASRRAHALLLAPARRSAPALAQLLWRCVPLALENCGRHGLQALQHLRALAKTRATLEFEGDGAEHAAGALVQKWGAWLSVALYRANAEVVWSALGPERRAAGDLAVGLAG